MTSKIKVNILADGGDNSIITSDGAGSFTASSGLASSVQSVGGLQNTPAFFSIMSGNQTISATTNTLINYDNEQLDTDGAFDTTNKRFTVPTGKGGYYFLYAAIGVDDGNATSIQTVTFFVNGNRQNTTGFGTRSFATAGSFGLQTSAIFNLSAGDYVDARVFLETATNIYNQLLYDNMRSRFFGYKLIGV